MEAEGTCMISARRFTISCHFRMISEGTSIECAKLEAVILRLRSGPFSVDTLVHAEQFLGLDGEGSITAPAAARDSLFDHLAARTTNAAGISRPREFAVEVSRPDQAAPRFQAAFRAETSVRAISSASLRCSGPRPTPSARMNAASLMPMNPKKLVRKVS